MIKLEYTEIVGWDAAIRGMRNPMNSWDRIDSYVPECIRDCENCDDDTCKNTADSDGNIIIGPNDHNLMTSLANWGPVHAKYRRMINVYVDIIAPLYWWKEFDTYKVGTVANSCSTMHKIHEKEFTLDDFSCEHLVDELELETEDGDYEYWLTELIVVIAKLNFARDRYLETKDKKYWWQMIQLLPSSYNQRRTVMMNYEVLAGIYPMRKDHKLDEWHEFCHWIENLPYSEIIVLGNDVVGENNV